MVAEEGLSIAERADTRERLSHVLKKCSRARSGPQRLKAAFETGALRARLKRGTGQGVEGLAESET